MRIDYRRGLLSREDEPVAGAGTRMRIENGVMCVPVVVNGGTPRWTRVDTGCTFPLYWCAGADCRRNGGARSLALASFTGSAVRAQVRVGTADLADLPVKIRAREIFPGEAGLLGNGALSRYRVTIDRIGNRLVLEQAE